MIKKEEEQVSYQNRRFSEQDYATTLRIIQKLSELIKLKRENGEDVAASEEENKSYHPETVFLDTQEGIELVADAIAHDHPVVTDYGATYGTAFSVNIRHLIAEARKEQEPLAVVSLVCTKKDALHWMNKNRLHPSIVKAVEKKGLDILDIISGVAFIRFPCTDEAQEKLGAHYVNNDQEIQVFIVDNDPLMDYLAKKYNIHYIAVRSSNITGKPEEPFVTGAEEYAKEIGAPIFAVRSRKAYQAQLDDHKAITSSTDAAYTLHRERVGSQPILAFKTIEHGALIELVRAGNTSEETIKRLLSTFLEESDIQFEYHEEKKAAHKRLEYHVPDGITDPEEIKERILKASLL